jgi:chromosome segregation ATPase
LNSSRKPSCFRLRQYISYHLQAKADEEGKLKLELTIKSINELKKEVEMLRAELRNTTNELGEVESEECELKKLLNSKLIEIEKLKKEGISLHGDNEKLLNEHYRLRAHEDEILHEIKKLSETIRDYEARLSEINRKIL